MTGMRRDEIEDVVGRALESAGTAGGPPGTGQYFFAIATAPFSGGVFGHRMTNLAGAIAGQQGARLPGARRFERRRENERSGVEVEQALITRIEALAA
jgi:(2R)-3-sulfolactate dehydrogenase (NADP+)